MKIENGMIVPTGTKFNEVRTEGDKVFVNGYVRIWGHVNENGLIYTKNSFDKFLKSYFEDNKMNVVLHVQHMDGIESLAGKFTRMEKNDTGVFVEAEISKHAIHYQNIIGLIEDRILQGFSDVAACDKVREIEHEGKNAIEISECRLLNISLVTQPSEVGASANIMRNTIFKGFGFNEVEKVEEKGNGIALFKF